LSIPELIKRLITVEAIVKQLRELNAESPHLFPDVEDLKGFIQINRYEENQYTGWFQGDGDEIGKFLQVQSDGDEATILETFSKAMMNWGKRFPYYLYPWENQTLPTFKDPLPPLTYRDGRIIYAGGNDFLGVLFRNDSKNPLTAKECLQWFFHFKQVWQPHKQEINVSIGFVWAAPNVPQRDVLQHCRETEKLAKNNGRDRLAIRILFNSGNHLDWHCPWWFLKDLLESYRDRDGNQNWTHFYNDVAVLESRHAFPDHSSDVAKALFKIYFDDPTSQLNQTSHLLESNLQGTDSKTKILPDTQDKTVNNWIINLAKVGFHLYD
jgi:CRISPR-associated protein Cmr2